MGMNTAASDAMLLLVYNGTTWAGIGQNVTAGPDANLYLAWHTGDPGPSGNQTTNETGYTNYVRQPIARTTAGFTVTLNTGVSSTVQLVTGQSTPMSGGSAANITYFSIGTASAGAGQIIHSGTVTPPITINTNVTPQLQAGTFVTQT